MRSHAYDYLMVVCPFMLVAPWEVFVELFIDNLNDLTSKAHNFKVLSHDEGTLLPFLQARPELKDLHWTTDEASFILQHLRAPPRDWTYLCIIQEEGAKCMAITWLDQEGRWYCELDPATDSAKDDYRILFEDDEDELTSNTARETPAQTKKSKLPPRRGVVKKKVKSHTKPTAKASKFVVSSGQMCLDTWLNK